MKTWILAATAVTFLSLSGATTRAEDPVKQPVLPPPVTEPKPKDPIDKPLPSAVPPKDQPKPNPGADPEPSENDSHREVKADKGDEFPTPAQLLERIRHGKAAATNKAAVAHFDLSSTLLEKPADFSFFGDNSGTTLRSLVKRLHAARDDENLRAVLVTLGAGDMNLAQAQEVRDALTEIKNGGKPVFVYADGFDTISYTVASGASDICLLEGGEIMIPGIGMETMFAKGLLDKIGVKADYVQIGEYKGADEQYTRTEASPELRGELNKLVDSMYAQMVADIAAHRGMAEDKVRKMIDQTILNAEQAKEQGFVDHLLHIDQLREHMGKRLDVSPDQLSLANDYGMPREDAPDFSNPFALLSFFTRKPQVSTQPAVALIYAEGTIVDGGGGSSLFGGSSVGSDEIRKAFRAAGRDPNVKAIVVRIDSPGGSALASEVMWQAARNVASKKPVVISVGSMAASGGYYLASAGDHIFADPSAIVGSIGVVGGKFVYKDLYGKLGLNAEAFSRGENADLFSSDHPFTDRQRTMVRNWMKGTYEQFTHRVMTTREGKIQDIDKVARGRIFLAQQAKDLGMVDELGGVEDALKYAAKKGGLDSDDFDVRVLPAPRTLADFFSGGAQAATPVHAAVPQGSSILGILPGDIRKPLIQQLDLLKLLESKPVILAAPFTVTVK